MQVTISARPPFDELMFDFFEQCITRLPENSQAYYVWADPADMLVPTLQSLEYSAPVVLLCVFDNLCLNDFDPWTHSRSHGVAAIADIALARPDTQFLLITSVSNLHQELQDIQNIAIIELGFITMESSQWSTVDVNLKKNFSSPTCFVSINNRAAAHRISCTSLLLSRQWDQFGTINISKEMHNHVNRYQSYLDMIAWQFNACQERDLKPWLCDGFLRLQKYQNVNSDFINGSFNRYAGNFVKYLAPLYSNHFVELVAETYYAEPSFMMTEKTLNSVHGKNFPIWISGAGSVAYLENLGMDVFRDIINHNYDQETNPFDRLVKLLDDNQRILTDVDYAKSQWLQCANRFDANIAFVRKSMYETIKQRAWMQFHSAIERLD